MYKIDVYEELDREKRQHLSMENHLQNTRGKIIGNCKRNKIEQREEHWMITIIEWKENLLVW